MLMCNNGVGFAGGLHRVVRWHMWVRRSFGVRRGVVRVWMTLQVVERTLQRLVNRRHPEGVAECYGHVAWGVVRQVQVQTRPLGCRLRKVKDVWENAPLKHG